MKKQTVLHETIFVDFKSKTVLQRKTKKIKIAITETQTIYDFSNFNEVPQDSNFADFSEKDRMEYSDHILNHIHEASFSDLVHWANNGMIDLKKVDQLLKLDRPGYKPKSKR